MKPFTIFLLLKETFTIRTCSILESFFRKLLSKATFERKLSSVSLPLQAHVSQILQISAAFFPQDSLHGLRLLLCKLAFVCGYSLHYFSAMVQRVRLSWLPISVFSTCYIYSPYCTGLSWKSPADWFPEPWPAAEHHTCTELTFSHKGAIHLLNVSI